MDKLIPRDQLEKEVRSMMTGEIDDETLKEGIDNLYTAGISVSSIYAGASLQDELCERCGECCRVCNPIHFSKPEMKKLAAFLKLSVPQLQQKYQFQKDSRGESWYSLQKPCPFLNKDNLCDVYKVRPNVCKIYPIERIKQIYETYGILSVTNEVCACIRKWLVYCAAMDVLMHHIEKHDIKVWSSQCPIEN